MKPCNDSDVRPRPLKDIAIPNTLQARGRRTAHQEWHQSVFFAFKLKLLFCRETLEVDPTPTSVDSPKRNLRYELYNFWKHNYSANLMCACLVHDESLDRMEEIAKAHFLAIGNKNIPERIWPSKPFRSSQMRIMIHVVPVKDIYHANLTFPMEDFHEHYAASPCGYVAQLIGHKGPKGLFSQLKAQGLAHHLVAGKKTLARGFSFFVITVQMTEEGERRMEEVVKSVFQYIQLIRGECISHIHIR